MTIGVRKVSANGIELHYQQHGQGSDVILVHGLTSNLAFWTITVLPKLVERHRVTIYDLRGHGFSDVPPTGYTSCDMAQDLHGLMDTLGIARAHVVGHSFGGTIAMHHALLYPDRVGGLVVTDPAIPALRKYQSFQEWPMYGEVERQLGEYGVKLPEGGDLWDLAALLPELKNLPMQHGLRQGKPRRLARMDRLMSQTTVMTDFHEVAGLTEELICTVQAPTLAIYGELSPFLGSCRFLEEHLPHVRSLILPGSGHLVPALAPDVFVEQVLTHFASVERDSVASAR